MAKNNKAHAKQKILPFGHRLVLNQWLVKQCGHDPLANHRAGKRKFHPLEGLAKALKDEKEGLDDNGLHYFYSTLNNQWQQKASVSQHDLLRYEQNIVSHTQKINEGRNMRPIIWKYYQYLSLLLTEIYLDNYFQRRDQLLASLNKFVEDFNVYWTNEGLETGITPYALEDLNKICLQNATGSGKTLLMHINFLQFRHYADKSSHKDDIARTLLITPNEGLSRQHAREITASGLCAARLSVQQGDLFTSKNKDLRQIDYTEITKLSDEDGVNQMAVRNLGDSNLLLVDEAHRGMGSKEETGWFKNRERLVEKGFAFEYSATFKEAITAAKDAKIEMAYAKNILFDYSYRYFYEDGYGKDYRIYNLPKSYQDVRFTYLTACLLSFYQQLLLYVNKQQAFHDYNLEKPLWVFVGKSVSKATGTKDEKQTVSDVALILKFMADFLKDKSKSAAIIERILNNNAGQTGLLDEAGNDIFSGSFNYIKDYMRHENMDHLSLLKDIFQKLFLNSSGGELTLAKIKGDESEIMLRVGVEEIPFGLINVGDASGLMKHIEQEKIERPADFSHLSLQYAEFSQTLFGQVHESSSPITVLLGSKKFVEGWDCWRVSTLGLMHVGKSEGSQIIQLFGRGVRLKGKDWTLKRSGFVAPMNRPESIQYLETLNIFGVQADFMEKFKKFLQGEELPSNDQKQTYEIPLHVTHDFGNNLKILRPRKKKQDGEDYDFKKDAKTPTLGDLPDKLKSKMIEIDWYPRIQSLASDKKIDLRHKNQTIFSPKHLTFLNYDDLFYRLEKFKRERGWHKLNIPKSAIQPLLADGNWYNMVVPEQTMEIKDVFNISYWQDMAGELLQKYCDALYNHAKAAFMEPRLEFYNLTKDDKNIPHQDNYELIVDSNEPTLITAIKDLKYDIEKKKEKGLYNHGTLKALNLNQHLYEPVMHVEKGSKIQIAPVFLNESEFQFVEDLYDHLRKTESKEDLYLLRNESCGKGVGFFEAGNFYPDFLLWKIKDNKQFLAFIEPHGLLHEGPGHKKIQFHKIIKNIQNRLKAHNICLNSFIVTPTRYNMLNWGLTIQELENQHVMFMEDSKGSYISKIASRMEQWEVCI